MTIKSTESTHTRSFFAVRYGNTPMNVWSELRSDISLMMLLLINLELGLGNCLDCGDVPVGLDQHIQALEL